MSDPTPPPEPNPGDTPPQGSRSNDGGVPSAQTAPTASTSGSGRYAVYDTRYERFVGGVSDKKPTTKAARDLVGHDDVDVREV